MSPRASMHPCLTASSIPTIPAHPRHIARQRLLEFDSKRTVASCSLCSTTSGEHWWSSIALRPVVSTPANLLLCPPKNLSAALVSSSSQTFPVEIMPNIWTSFVEIRLAAKLAWQMPRTGLLVCSLSVSTKGWSLKHATFDIVFGWSRY